jgi:ankyrin repeat protein
LNGHLKVAQKLLTRGTNVNSKGKNEWTSLHLAAQNGHFEIMQVLLNHRAGMKAKAIKELTPLHYAA